MSSGLTREHQEKRMTYPQTSVHFSLQFLCLFSAAASSSSSSSSLSFLERISHRSASLAFSLFRSLSLAPSALAPLFHLKFNCQLMRNLNHLHSSSSSSSSFSSFSSSSCQKLELLNQSAQLDSRLHISGERWTLTHHLSSPINLATPRHPHLHRLHRLHRRSRLISTRCGRLDSSHRLFIDLCRKNLRSHHTHTHTQTDTHTHTQRHTHK